MDRFCGRRVSSFPASWVAERFVVRVVVGQCGCGRGCGVGRGRSRSRRERVKCPRWWVGSKKGSTCSMMLAGERSWLLFGFVKMQSFTHLKGDSPPTNVSKSPPVPVVGVGAPG